jgi:hypothetical protein
MLFQARTSLSTIFLIVSKYNVRVAVARSMTDSFSGIRPVDLAGFVSAELCGAITAMLLLNWRLRGEREGAAIDREVGP